MLNKYNYKHKGSWKKEFLLPIFSRSFFVIFFSIPSENFLENSYIIRMQGSKNSLFIRFVSFQTRSEPILLHYPPVFPSNPCKYWVWRDFFIKIWILLPSTVHAFTLPQSSFSFSFFFRFLFFLIPCKHCIYSYSSQSCCPSKTYILLFFFHHFYAFFFPSKPYRMGIFSFLGERQSNVFAFLSCICK